jgi:hypothetical protein
MRLQLDRSLAYGHDLNAIEHSNALTSLAYLINER